MNWINKIHCGDALKLLRHMPDNFVNMVMTSPPYWNLRNYQEEGQIGLEESPFDYLDKIWKLFDEIKRVLKKTGSVYVNYGDTYWNTPTGSLGNGAFSDRPSRKATQECKESRKRRQWEYKNKCMCLIPERFAIGMVDRGWILRNKPIWCKTNAMPGSWKDRFTNRWEYVYFFTKSNTTQYWINNKIRRLTVKQPPGISGLRGKDWVWEECDRCEGGGCAFCSGAGKLKVNLWTKKDYFFDLDAVREPYKPESLERLGRGIDVNNKYNTVNDIRLDSKNLCKPRLNRNFNYRVRDAAKKGILCPQFKASTTEIEKYQNRGKHILNKQHSFYEHTDRGVEYGELKGKNPGDVWMISAKHFKEAHFATYPEDLCVLPIKASCPEFICKKCGLIRYPVVEPTEEYKRLLKENKKKGLNDTDWFPRKDLNLPAGRKSGPELRITSQYIKTGYTDCGCNAGFRPGIVLDPFSGAGTTCLVARKLGRSYIGIEIKPEYVKMEERRIHNEAGLL